MNGVPHELDWVTKRAECSAAQVFMELELDVERDVELINSKRQTPPKIGFSKRETFFAAYQVENSQSQVRFTLRDGHLEITGISAEPVMVALTLNDEGRCKLKVEGKELEQWQVRRMALEKLFFGPF